MALSVTSGTTGQTAGGAESIINAPQVAGEFQLKLDLNLLAAGDVIELRAYEMVKASGTSRVLFYTMISGAQPTDAQILLSEWIANTLTDTNAIQFGIKQLFGTTRALPYSVLNRQDYTVGDFSATMKTSLNAATPVVTIAAAGIQAIWDALTSALTTAGSIGKRIVDFGATGAGLTSLATAAQATAIQADTDDIQTRLPAALTSGGNMKAGIQGFLDSVFTEGAVGRIAAAFKQFFNIASPAATMDHGILVDTATTLTNAPADSSGVTTLLSRLSALRAGYLDNLSAGAHALESSLQALITTVGVAGAGLTAADDAVITAIAALNNLSQANIRTAIGLGSANLDTQLSAIAGYIDTEVAAILATVNSGTYGNSALKTLIDSVNTAIAALNNLAAGAAMTLTAGERNAIADAAFARSLGTESVAADGAVPTFAQAIFALLSLLGQFSISGNTITCYGLDGTTILFTYTLDSATAPTSRTRAT